jgi:hypothetical protein
MTEEQILNAIADAYKDDNLNFQIIIQENSLHIYINRPTKEYLDYHQLKQRIYSVIMELPTAKFKQIWLYCRILGEIEPDWQSVLEIETNTSAADEITSMVAIVNSAMDATNTIVSKIEQQLEISESFREDPQIEFEDLPTTAEDAQKLFNLSEAELSELLEDSFQENGLYTEPLSSVSDKFSSGEREIISGLSNYCFIRNRRLLYAVLDTPWLNIARLIDTFSRFDLAIQRSQLPILEAYFEESILPNFDQLEPKLHNWWTEMKQLDSDDKHKIAIWLSRYCCDPQTTISIIKEVLLTQASVANERGSKPKPEKLNADSDSSDAKFSLSKGNQKQKQDQNLKVELELPKSLTMLWRKLKKILRF